MEQAGFVHAFSTRRGGVSSPPFDETNLGRGMGDPAAVEENRAILARQLGYEQLFELQQVHGGVAHEVGATSIPGDIAILEGDALVLKSHRPGAALAVRTADCVPVLLAHPRSGGVAAVHSGWRSTEARVVEAAVERLALPPSELIAAIGPHIRAASFEVGLDIAERLQALAPGASVVDRTQTKPRVDLTAIIRFQLEALGVSAVDDVGGCTLTESNRFFSHRRDGSLSGRHLSVIVSRASPSREAP